MPRPFNINARVSSFELPAHTKQQIAALMDDLSCDARVVVEMAVAQLWQRELGEAERDVFEELDEVKRRLNVLEGDNAMEPSYYVISQHGSDGSAGIDSVAWCAERPANSQTQTAFGPFVTEKEAETFKAKL